MTMRLLLQGAPAILMAFSVVTFASGATIHVPADQPTIQAAINAASNGDTVLVAPGTYSENINFNGKSITVRSSGGAKVTIIDGGQRATVVTFDSNETNASVIMGFTIQNGVATNVVGEGGGISVEGSSPTISNNTIVHNQACQGNGIGVGFGSPIIQHNLIAHNTETTCGGIGGGGIGVRGASTAEIVGNTITDNSVSSYGGGIALWSGDQVLIKNNIIERNTSALNGGGISMFNTVNDVVIVQNLIVSNGSPTGDGVYWSNPPGTLVDNTIADSTLPLGGSTVWGDNFSNAITIANNIVIATKGAKNAFTCNYADFSTPSAFFSNDIFSNNGQAYGGVCTKQTGSHGNISAPPLFVGATNFLQKAGSPTIDTGNNTSPDLPKTDLAGNPRIVNGNGGSTAIVDIGAYEYMPVTLTPKTLNFGLQIVGSTTIKTVTLTNAQNKTLGISSMSVPTGYTVSGCGTSVAALSSCSLTVTFEPLMVGSFKGMLVVKDNAGNSPQTVNLSGSAH